MAGARLTVAVVVVALVAVGCGADASEPAATTGRIVFQRVDRKLGQIRLKGSESRSPARSPPPRAGRRASGSSS